MFKKWKPFRLSERRANQRRIPSEQQSQQPEPRPHIPLPAEVLIDRDAAVSIELQKQHWLDEAFNSFAANGGLDQLPGKGKPLVIPTGDVMYTLLKNANVPHPWILLQQIIKEELEEASLLLARNPEDPIIDQLLGSANRKIIQLNAEAPSLSLHRRKVTRDNLREQLERWS